MFTFAFYLCRYLQITKENYFFSSPWIRYEENKEEILRRKLEGHGPQKEIGGLKPLRGLNQRSGVILKCFFNVFLKMI